MLLLLLRASAEWCRASGLAGVLLAIVHFLLELLRLLFVDKAQRGQAIFQVEGVEEGTVLVIAPCVEDLLIPEDTATRRLERLLARLDESHIMGCLPRYPPS